MDLPCIKNERLSRFTSEDEHAGLVYLYACRRLGGDELRALDEKLGPALARNWSPIPSTRCLYLRESALVPRIELQDRELLGRPCRSRL